MFHLVLFQPEIPPNTGNIIRLCANTGAQLHLIHPLGFKLDDRQLRRAGLDYHEWATIQEHKDFDNFKANTTITHLFACSTKGITSYINVKFKPNDALLFGPETRGLPQSILENLPNERIIRIPMLPKSRSLNLSNAAAIILYEAYRQSGFAHANLS